MFFAEFRIYQSLGRRNHKVDQNLFPVLQGMPYNLILAKTDYLAN